MEKANRAKKKFLYIYILRVRFEVGIADLRISGTQIFILAGY